MFKNSKRCVSRLRLSIKGAMTTVALVLAAGGCAGGRLSSTSAEADERDASAPASESQGVVIKGNASKAAAFKEAAAKSKGSVPQTAVLAPDVAVYRQTLARHIRAASADQAFEGVPPNPLYAIVVLSWQIDAEGKVSNLRVLRSAAHAPTTDKLALESVRRAQTLPKPSSTVLRQGGGGKRLTVLESWLFKDAKHFQLRTLAQNQASE